MTTENETSTMPQSRSEAAPKGRRRSPSLPEKLALLLLSLVFSLIVLEVLVRLVGLDVPRVWVPDPELGWRHLPLTRRHFTEEGDGLIEINSLGYRDRERKVEKPPGVFRIVLLGDSMTEAVQVNREQDYASLLETYLRRIDPKIEVWNLGVNGYSPIQELLLLRQEVDRLRPDLVIVGLFLDNDVAGCHPALSTTPTQSPFLKEASEGDAIAFDFSRSRRSYEDYQKEPIRTLRSGSATYRLASTLREQFRGRMHAAAQDQAHAEGPQPVPLRYRLYLPEDQSGPEWKQAWTDFERVVEEFDRETRRRGIGLVLLDVPAAQVVREDVWKHELERHPGMAGRTWEIQGPSKRLAAMAKNRQLPLIDPGTAFRNSPDGTRLFFGNVGHMTPEGHQLLAGVVQRFLREQGALPGKGRTVASGPVAGSGTRSEQVARGSTPTDF